METKINRRIAIGGTTAAVVTAWLGLPVVAAAEDYLFYSPAFMQLLTQEMDTFCCEGTGLRWKANRAVGQHTVLRVFVYRQVGRYLQEYEWSMDCFEPFTKGSRREILRELRSRNNRGYLDMLALPPLP